MRSGYLGFCIRTLSHFGHLHFRFLWKIWPFSSFMRTLQVLQVMAELECEQEAPASGRGRRNRAPHHARLSRPFGGFPGVAINQIGRAHV